MEKGHTNRVAVGKPRVGIALPGGVNASGNIYNSLRSPEVSESYLKCFYIDAGSMKNKLDELEVLVSAQSNSTLALSETWWNGCHNWRGGMEGYGQFRRDRQGRQGGGVTLY